MSLKSTHYKYKMGACIVYKNRCIGRGKNELKTHPNSTSFHKRLHAEHSALLSSRIGSKPLNKGTSIYVFRASKNGIEANSKPCKACQKLLKDSGIEKVYYTENGGYSCFTL